MDVEKKRPAIDGDEFFSGLTFQQASDCEYAEILKALGEDIPDGYIAGWASTSGIDNSRHSIAPGAFSEAIRKKGISGPRGIKLLIGHDRKKPAGVIKALEYRGDRLWIEAQLNLNISYVADAYEAAKMNKGFSFSVGVYRAGIESEIRKDRNGHEYLLITKGDLFEVSVEPFPDNEDAIMTFIKSRDIDAPITSITEFEKAIVAKGLVKSRNDAMRITQEVKSVAHLFSKGREDPESNQPTAQNPPRLAVEQIEQLSSLIAKMKQEALR